jgi:MFS family permease
MSATTAGPADQPGHITGFGSRGYRMYVLLSLMLVYTLNFIDRSLIGVVGQPIMNSFGLNDAQWGLLNGPPFALFYAFMGIPIAMWADRGNRVFIIGLCIVIWSLMTAFCGLAAGFIWLLLFRVGVAIGEAGCTPPANSLITDYFPPKSRANALGIYSMGVTIGGVLAQLFGGSIASIKGEQMGSWLEGLGLGFLFHGIQWETVEGWRIAFVVIGTPGLLIAFLIWFTTKEPPRGYSDPPAATVEKAGFFEAFAEFARKPTFWTLSLGAAFVAFVGYGLFAFQTPFLMRVHGISLHDAAVKFGAPLSAVAAGGTFLGGFLSEKLSHRFESVAAWLPGVGLLIAVPAYCAAFLTSSLTVAICFWVVAAVTHYAYLGAQYTVGTAIVSPRARATTISVLLFIVALIGNGIGPMFTGWMSTHFMVSSLKAQGLGDQIAAFEPKLCGPAIDQLGDAGPALCSAYAEGLRHSMVATVMIFLIAAVCYFLAARTFQRDRYNPSVIEV